MYVRVVRFTDVNAERMNDLIGRMNEAEGPPEGVPATGIQVLVDSDQGTAVVLQLFDSQEDMETGAKALSAMDPADTPGTRVSVDACELKADRRVN